MNTKFIKEVGTFNWAIRTLQRQFYKRLLKRNHFIKLPSGKRFMLPVGSKFASEVFVSSADVDWGSEALLFKLLQKKGAFLDVGANIGYYSLYMLPGVKKVYSFEPDPRTLILLKQNTIDISDIQVMSTAIGRQKGKINFILESDGEVSHLATGEDNTNDKIEIDITTIDDFVKENKLEVEAIKIDIEGFDIDAIAGAMQTLKSQRPIVLTEAIPSLELFDIVQEVSYKIFAFIRDVKSRNKHFSEIKNLVAQNMTTKMLFLIPEELEEKIIKLV